jgi:hypothetical protein
MWQTYPALCSLVLVAQKMVDMTVINQPGGNQVELFLCLVATDFQVACTVRSTQKLKGMTSLPSTNLGSATKKEIFQVI